MLEQLAKDPATAKVLCIHLVSRARRKSFNKKLGKAKKPVAADVDGLGENF
jgi:hypothetical protein